MVKEKRLEKDFGVREQRKSKRMTGISGRREENRKKGFSHIK